MAYIQPPSQIFRQDKYIIISGPKETYLIEFDDLNKATKALSNFEYEKNSDTKKSLVNKQRLIFSLLGLIILILGAANFIINGQIVVSPIIFVAPNLNLYSYLQLGLFMIAEIAFFNSYFKNGKQQQLTLLEEFKQYKQNLKIITIQNKERSNYFKQFGKGFDNLIFSYQILINLTVCLAFNLHNSYYTDGLSYLILGIIAVSNVFISYQLQNHFGQILAVKSFEEAKPLMNSDVERNIKLIKNPTN